MSDKVCAYKKTPCRGKIEWHHPIAGVWKVGLYLCEAHHSLIQGRKKLYNTELMMDRQETVAELKALERSVVVAAGYDACEIDKK